ncbi:MAG TPA: energy transducer TonB [Terriglobales bacterium]|nr:energy transducer TonB [Terriglobales bacterium]
MSSRTTRRWMAGSLLTFLCLGGTAVFHPLRAQTRSAPSHGELTRKTKTQVAAVYPDVARRMSITGTVKVLVVVAPNGNLKSTKVVGGHPLLVNAAMDAIKKWKFEPAGEESTGIVEFKFQPQD